MSEISVKLTKRTVDAAEAEGARRVIWDAELRGFGLRIEPSGAKTFLVRYRPKGTGRAGAKRFVTLGRYGPTMTPEQARTKAKSVLGQVADGRDPALARNEDREAATVAELAERYLEEQIVPLRKASTASLYGYYFRALIVPVIGSKKAAKVTHADVRRLWITIGKSRPVTANRAVAAISGLFTFAIKTGQATGNPAKGIEKFKERPRQRFLSAEELGRLGAVLHDAETVGLPYVVDETSAMAKHAAKPENRRRKLDPFGVAAIRLLLLTGARLREVLHARWEWFDAARGVLRLPDSKTGAKSIYLSAAALAVLDGLPRVQGNPFMVPGSKAGEPRADLKKPWEAVTKAAGLDGVRLHDLRHTFASYGAGAHLGLHVIGGLLGHAQPKTTQRYAHLDADPMHRAANTIGSVISAALDKKAGADVVPIWKAVG